MVERPQPLPSSRYQTRITPGAVVCSECELSGEVTIGANTIIHPKARILAEAGAIQIGAFNLIEEQVEIINRVPDSVLKIGDHNVFEVGAHCEAAEIGDNNVFEAKSMVGPQVRITNGCVIGAMCSLTSNETLPECTVIYGDEVCGSLVSSLIRFGIHECIWFFFLFSELYNRPSSCSQRETSCPDTQTLQLDFLTKILPNYHHLLKASRPSNVGSAFASPKAAPK
ncbi:unnamed protein product [Echinostoma caproni]|uniref:Dynactin subunit 6 n=1 Tax=Echinostoma caproni TaxID=27848 RepID=A0A183ANZ5_9TREM|nr:unnamed protein product [Echinostoma caproni]